MKNILVLLFCWLFYAANTASASPYASFNIASAQKMPVVVTVSPDGSVSIFSNDISTNIDMYLGEVRAKVGRQIECPNGFSTVTFWVQEWMNGYSKDTFKLIKGSAHFKGMKSYVWQELVPIATVSSLVKACKTSLTPEHQVILRVNYTCNGKNEIKIYAPTDYDLVCQPPPVPTTKPQEVAPVPASTPRQFSCRKPGDCPRGTTCVSGICK